MEPIIGFIPCRKGSERVKNKNTRPFASFQNGLLELKLLQMAKVSGIEKIIVSSNDDKVLEIVHKMRKLDSRLTPMERPEEYGNSATSMESFTQYIAELEPEGSIFWTHVTHPFLSSDYYSEIIQKYLKIREMGYDSLVTVTQIQKFIWSNEGPYNYDNTIEKWPRSQDLVPLFEINHGVYMLPFAKMRDVGDRIGNKPYLYNLPESAAQDIDWEEQFNILEDIAKAKLNRGSNLL